MQTSHPNILAQDLAWSVPQVTLMAAALASHPAWQVETWPTLLHLVFQALLAAWAASLSSFWARSSRGVDRLVCPARGVCVVGLALDEVLDLE